MLNSHFDTRVIAKLYYDVSPTLITAAPAATVDLLIAVTSRKGLLFVMAGADMGLLTESARFGSLQIVTGPHAL